MPYVMERPPGTCTFERRHSQSMYWTLPESSRNNYYLISYSMLFFKQRLQTVKVADYKTARATRKCTVCYYDAEVIHKNI